MKRLAVAVALAAVAAGLVAERAAATGECRGLRVCVSIAGPWVVVPTGGAPRPEVEFQLDCPHRFVIGGLDAELSDRGIDIRFDGKLGSPVNPGVTTSSSAVFRAVFTGAPTRTPSFRPRLGCIPSAGGGGGIPTSLQVFPPGKPSARHVRTVDVHRGVQRVTQRCAAGEQLVSGAVAVGFYTLLPPPGALAHAVRATLALAPRAAVATVRAGRRPGPRAVAQVAAVCSGGR